MALDIIKYSATALTRHEDKHDFYYRNKCNACPLKNAAKVNAYGAKNPVVYLLGGIPSKLDVQYGKPFSGDAGDMLRRHIPKDWLKDERKLLRWGNCLRSPTPKDRGPNAVELASCRTFVEDDIIATKPVAVFGFGPVPLQWFGVGDSNVTLWSGRHIPVTIKGSTGKTHTCWYFPLFDPAYVCEKANAEYGEARLGFKSEVEFAFHMHLKRAFELVDTIGEAPAPHTRVTAMEGVSCITTYDNAALKRIFDFMDYLSANERVVGFDYETSHLRPYNDDARILTAALSGSQGTLAFPLYHREAKWPPALVQELARGLFRFLHKAPCIKAVHQAAFEMEWTAVKHKRAAVRADTWACTMSQAYILDERQGGLSLDFLTRQYFGFSIKALNPVDRKNLDNVPLRQMLPYNGGDAKWHRKLYLKQAKRIKKEGLTAVYKEHMRRVRSTVLMQVKGLPVDPSVNERLLEKYTTERKKQETAIRKSAEARAFFQRTGRDYNPSSNPDTVLLLDKVLPDTATSKVRDERGKIPNAQEGTLSQIKHPFSKLLLAWRKPNKIITTYLEPLSRGEGSKLFDDGLAHPQTRTTTVVTWRTSSDEFNYQNFPKRDGDRKEVRGQVRKKGYKVVSFDYAGIQARNIAMESLDAALIKAFKERYDIHSDWCETIARLAPRWVKEGVKALANDKKLFKDYRNIAKNKFVFPSMFGAKPTTVAHYMGLDNDIGYKLQEMLWERFPDIHKWHKRLLKQYRQLGYITGHSGWRRRAPISPNELINSPIQGDEAIIVCDAMNRLSETGDWLLQSNMEIHDDLTFLWPAEEVERLAPIVIDTMVNTPFEWAHVVPLGVEMSIGDDWHKQDNVGEYFTDTWKGSL